MWRNKTLDLTKVLANVNVATTLLMVAIFMTASLFETCYVNSFPEGHQNYSLVDTRHKSLGASTSLRSLAKNVKSTYKKCNSEKVFNGCLIFAVHWISSAEIRNPGLLDGKPLPLLYSPPRASTQSKLERETISPVPLSKQRNVLGPLANQKINQSCAGSLGSNPVVGIVGSSSAQMILLCSWVKMESWRNHHGPRRNGKMARSCDSKNVDEKNASYAIYWPNEEWEHGMREIKVKNFLQPFRTDVFDVLFDSDKSCALLERLLAQALDLLELRPGHEPAVLLAELEQIRLG